MKLNIKQNDIEIYKTTSFFKRFKGLMFKRNFNYGLCFPKCNSIHTFFMFESIDVVMTDIDNNILHIYKNLTPWRVILPKKNVYYTYEFPKGFIDKKIRL